MSFRCLPLTQTLALIGGGGGAIFLEGNCPDTLLDYIVYVKGYNSVRGNGKNIGFRLIFWLETKTKHLRRL